MILSFMCVTQNPKFKTQNLKIKTQNLKILRGLNPLNL